MTQKKRRIIATDFEYRLIVKALAQFRNEILENGKPTEDIDQSATQMFEQLVGKLKTQGSISEDLKGKDQLTWIGAMNSIQNRATEIVNNEFIFD